MTRLAARFPNAGPYVQTLGAEAMATAAEEAGVDSLHLGDHVVLCETSSPYPFAPDQVFRFPPTTDWYETLATCAWLAAVTERIEVGPSVLVLPQRHPLEVAKVSATIDRLSRGRIFLGIGAGWLAEEFAALGWDFDSRFGRLEESIEVLRLAWSGTGEAYTGKHLTVPPGIQSRPLPVRGHIPLLLGGMTPATVRRAARSCDGWIAVTEPAEPDYDGLARLMSELSEALSRHGRDRRSFRAVVRLIDQSGRPTTAQLPELAHTLAGMGFDEVGVDPLWHTLPDATAVLTDVRAALLHS